MNDNRPLSPHLSVYRYQLTSVLSILHRATGVVLSLSALLFVYWLAALATGPERYGTAEKILGSVFGQLVIFGGLFSFFYHLCNGVRHLFWDAGKGLEISRTYTTGWIVVIVSILLTGCVIAYAMTGAPA